MHSDLASSANEAIRLTTGDAAPIVRLTEIAGGSISRSLVAETRNGKWFVKVNRAGLLAMFEAEADGLRALAACPEVRVPRAAGCVRCGGHALLVLDFIEMRPLRGGPEGEKAGRALAALHRIAGQDFGWRRDNFIGSTPQSNRSHRHWPEFFASERLMPQLNLATQRGAPAALIDKGNRLADGLRAFFSGYRPVPSLLHGDLWGGNAAADPDGRLVLFDPAVYHGDREADLAMSELFGGFPAAFHAAYRDAWALAEGYAQRKTLYNLYHVLNHFNLFGGGYGRQAERMLDALLAEIG